MRVDLRWVLPLGVLLLAGCEEQFTPDPPLRVERVRPDPGAQLYLNQPIRIEFNAPIDPISVTPATVKVLDENGNSVPGRRILGSRSVRFEPVPPMRKDLSDGSFQANRDYRLVVSGFPLSNSVRSTSGEVLQGVFQQKFRTVPLIPVGYPYPSPLLPVGVGIERFQMRLRGSLSREVAAGSGRLRIQFTLPVLPTSLSPEGFVVQLLRFQSTTGTGTEVLTPIDARLLSLPEPIDQYPGSTVELRLGDVGLAPGDLLAVRMTGGPHALQDYRGRELEPDLEISFTVVEGDRVPLAEWPDDEPFQPLEQGKPSFEVGREGIQPRLWNEAGAGGLGVFRPLRDTILRPGVPFDPGDGELVRSEGSRFEFLAVEIPAGVTVRVESADPVRILSAGDIRIIGKLELATPRTTSATDYLNVMAVTELPPAVLLRDSGLGLLAGGEIAVTGVVSHVGNGDTDASPLTVIAGAGFELRGLPLQTVLANPSGRITGTAAGLIPVVTSRLTPGWPGGEELIVESWSSWQGVPIAHAGEVRLLVEPDPLPDGVEVLVQVSPPDPLDPSRPDARTEVLEQPRSLASIQGGFEVPAGGFVRLLMRARVRPGAPLPSIRKVQVLAN